MTRKEADKPLPYSIEAEKALLGSMLIDPDAILRVRARGLTPAHFYREQHAWLCEAIYHLDDERRAVDTVTVVEELERRGHLDALGGPAAITELYLHTPTAIHAEHYAGVVKDKATLRAIIGGAERIARMAYSGVSADEARAFAAQVMQELAQGDTEHGPHTLKDVMAGVVDRVTGLYYEDKRPGLPTGFKDLDRLLVGYQPTDLIVIAARPSIGKTALALNSSKYVAERGAKVLFFSLEMSREQLAERWLALEADIDLQIIRHGPIRDGATLDKIVSSADKSAQGAVWIDDRGGLSVADIRVRSLALQAEHGLDLVVVDYLQLLALPDRKWGMPQLVGYNSGALKQLAKELRVPVVVLSQLSRGVEAREDKRPLLSDLRESGAIEQDADVVAFIYRDEVYNKNTDRPNIAEILVRKHRNGPTGTVELRFTKETGRFSDLEHIYHDKDAPPQRRNGRAPAWGPDVDDVDF